LQPCRSFVTRRTLIGGPAYQTRNGSDLSELLVIASDLTGACDLPPAFRRPKLWRRGYYAGPPKTCYAALDATRHSSCEGWFRPTADLGGRSPGDCLRLVRVTRGRGQHFGGDVDPKN
jgi:hypothetical protein